MQNSTTVAAMFALLEQVIGLKTSTAALGEEAASSARLMPSVERRIDRGNYDLHLRFIANAYYLVPYVILVLILIVALR
jgi:hypothetical protein